MQPSPLHTGEHRTKNGDVVHIRVGDGVPRLAILRLDRKSATRATACPGPAGAAYFRRGIDRVQKGETVEVGISGVNGADPILPHQDGSMRVKNQIARNSGHFGEHLCGSMTVPIGLDQNPQRRRREQRVEKGPSLVAGEGLGHDSGMGYHAEKLVDDAPSEIPRSSLGAARFEELAATVVFWSVLVGPVNENVGIDNEQNYPSITL